MILSDRMVRADTFNDGRLLQVSRGARLLAVGLEAAAESTGCVRDDVDEIRRAVGWFLAGADGDLPSVSEVDAWLQELVAAKWLIEYECAGTHGLYCKGFGERQRGYNVCIGVTAADTVAAHLPLPPCVTLVQNAEKRRALPTHCDLDYRLCPCDRDGLVTRRGLVNDESPNERKVEVEIKPRRELDLDTEVEEEGVAPSDRLPDGSSSDAPKGRPGCSICNGVGWFLESSGEHSPCPCTVRKPTAAS
jgi:hypothetical protein